MWRLLVPLIAALVGAVSAPPAHGIARRVLTAAHCVQGMTPRDVAVVLGDGPVGKGRRHAVAGIATHPDYRRWRGGPGSPIGGFDYLDATGRRLRVPKGVRQLMCLVSARNAGGDLFVVSRPKPFRLP